MSQTPTYQITKRGASGQFAKQADQLIAANLPWQEVCASMEGSPDANIDYALAALKANGLYSFHDADGNLCKIISHKVL